MPYPRALVLPGLGIGAGRCHAASLWWIMRGMRRVAAGLIVVALMLGAGGLAYGLMPLVVSARASCGSAFAGDVSRLSGHGRDLCAVARSARQGVAVSLLVAGGVGVAFALALFGAASDSERRETADLERRE